jgi:hypothetical protein
VAALELVGRNVLDAMRLARGGLAGKRDEAGEITPRGGVVFDEACACEVLVAWCISDGGALAIALAFARLAAIAAATLLFFGPDAAVLPPAARAVVADEAAGSGQALSTPLRACPSRPLRMTAARVGHTAWKDQNITRPASRAAGFVSTSPFLTSCSIAST